MSNTLGLATLLTLGGNLLRPAHTHSEQLGQLLQRPVTLIIGC
jgi:hypothetical protein